MNLAEDVDSRRVGLAVEDPRIVDYIGLFLLSTQLWPFVLRARSYSRLIAERFEKIDALKTACVVLSEIRPNSCGPLYGPTTILAA